MYVEILLILVHESQQVRLQNIVTKYMNVTDRFEI